MNEIKSQLVIITCTVFESHLLTREFKRLQVGLQLGNETVQSSIGIAEGKPEH